jgi:hypothetical protein
LTAKTPSDEGNNASLTTSDKRNNASSTKVGTPVHQQQQQHYCDKSNNCHHNNGNNALQIEGNNAITTRATMSV